MTPAPMANMDAELAAPHQRLEKARALAQPMMQEPFTEKARLV